MGLGERDLQPRNRFTRAFDKAVLVSVTVSERDGRRAGEATYLVPSKGDAQLRAVTVPLSDALFSHSATTAFIDAVVADSAEQAENQVNPPPAPPGPPVEPPRPPRS